jgi:heme-degrading monooxygenase HmoA
VIERHVSYEVPADKAQAFETFFVERYLPPAREMPGLIECILLRESDDPTRYQMVFRWETPDHALAWRTSPVHEGLQPELKTLVAGMTITAYTKIA